MLPVAIFLVLRRKIPRLVLREKQLNRLVIQMLLFNLRLHIVGSDLLGKRLYYSRIEIGENRKDLTGIH